MVDRRQAGHEGSDSQRVGEIGDAGGNLATDVVNRRCEALRRATDDGDGGTGSVATPSDLPADAGATAEDENVLRGQ